MLEPSGNEGCGISSRLFCSTSDSSAVVMPFSFGSVGAVEGVSDGAGAASVPAVPGSPPAPPATFCRTFCQKPGTMSPWGPRGLRSRTGTRDRTRPRGAEAKQRPMTEAFPRDYERVTEFPIHDVQVSKHSATCRQSARNHSEMNSPDSDPRNRGARRVHSGREERPAMTTATVTPLRGTRNGTSSDLDGAHRPVIVVGGGQAGLSMS